MRFDTSVPSPNILVIHMFIIFPRLKTSSEALAATKSTQSPIGLTPRQNQLERYANIQSKYGRLEESAIGRIYIMVKEHATNVISDSQRSRFICAVMEVKIYIVNFGFCLYVRLNVCLCVCDSSSACVFMRLFGRMLFQWSSLFFQAWSDMNPQTCTNLAGV